MLRVDRVGISYDGVPAVYEVSLTVNEGEIVSVVGANGAGKTTLMKAIAGAITPATGEIWWAERRIDRLPAHEVVGLGISLVPEGRRIFGKMTVEENLHLGGLRVRSSKERERLIGEVLRIFPRLSERRRHKGATLSGGEQQMLAIARALMSQPSLLMLDEPSLGLAPGLVEKVLEVVKAINRRGVAVLLVEQDVRDALEMADRAYVLQTGRIVAEGRGSELLQSDLIQKAYLGM